eukprot:1875053-Ditylum_brightwellii.AAC.1
MILFVTSVADIFWRKSRERLSKVERELDVEMENFCLAMDNYFTLPKVIKHLRENGICVVGTARIRRGWPLYELQKIQQKDCDLNEFRYLVGKNVTLIARWMDNGLVLLVSTLYSVGNFIQVERRRLHII